MERPKSRLAVALIVVGMLCAMLAVYVTGYFVGSDRYMYQPTAHVRVFKSAWQAAIYTPATWIETRIIGEPVVAGWR